MFPRTIDPRTVCEDDPIVGPGSTFLTPLQYGGAVGYRRFDRAKGLLKEPYVFLTRREILTVLARYERTCMIISAEGVAWTWDERLRKVVHAP